MYQKGCRVKDKRLRGAAIAQWIRLNLPSAAPGSSPKHTIYAFTIYSIGAIFVMKRTKISKMRPS